MLEKYGALASLVIALLAFGVSVWTRRKCLRDANATLARRRAAQELRAASAQRQIQESNEDETVWERRDDGRVHVMAPSILDKSQTAEIVRWEVKVGQRVAAKQPLAHVMYLSVTIELPSPVDGFVDSIWVQPGVEVDIGATLCSLRETSLEPPQQPANTQKR